MAAHEYDPDDNFDHAFHAQAGLEDEDALEAVAWQFLLLVNPDDEDAALEQFAAFQRALDEAGERADPDRVRVAMDRPYRAFAGRCARRTGAGCCATTIPGTTSMASISSLG